MPSTSRSAKILRYSLIGFVIVVLSGLGWWYFFLRAELDTLRTADTGRGLGSTAPSFGGIIGSTYSNIVERLSGSEGQAQEEQGPLPRLRRITQAPVAAIGFITREQGQDVQTDFLGKPVSSATSSLLRFVERGTGYVVDAEVGLSTVTRRTNTLIPQVYEGAVAANGSIILRSLEETGAIITNIGTVARVESPDDVAATSTALFLKALPKNIRSIAFGPSGEQVLYIMEENGVASITRASSDGSTPQRVARIGISGWDVLWLADGRMILVQDREDGLTGYAYEVGANGSLFSLANPAPGLSLLPKSGEVGSAQGALLYSSGFTLLARASADTSISTVPIRTVADKCVWAPGRDPIAYCAVPRTSLGAGALGKWLRGEVHSADAWWRVDVRSGRTDLLYEPGDTRLDVQHPTINPEGTYIAFQNGMDKSLWLLRISE